MYVYEKRRLLCLLYRRRLLACDSRGGFVMRNMMEAAPVPPVVRGRTVQWQRRCRLRKRLLLLLCCSSTDRAAEFWYGLLVRMKHLWVAWLLGFCKL